MTGNELRRAFLDYFAGQGHTEVPSSPVVPAEDPTLLFTNAGMNQFKRVFTGEETRAYARAVSAQKCIRVSGKHNDLENVGRTPRHHTFFEMMGNFSFGDYFKSEAAAFAWEFICDRIGLPKDRLYVTIYAEDDEAEQAWIEATDIDPDRIHRLGRKDNYWSMGETGPQGPCSELLFDLAPATGSDRAGIDPTDGDRFLEIWNLVFMQYDALASGELVSLPRPSIDTGLGLERLASVVQEVPGNYETDLMYPVIEEVCALTGIDYERGEGGLSHRVVADHIRGLVFAITDGVVPSNDGRGYVLRRLLRRAARHGRKLGVREPFIHRLVGTVVSMFGEAYPELSGAAERVELVIRTEEERFGETLDQGLQRFEEIAARVEEEGEIAIGGRDAFLLYDTYGFPLDLTQVMAEERGLPVDIEDFQKALAEQKERSRADRAGREGAGEEEAQRAAAAVRPEGGRTFVGYDRRRWKTATRIVNLFDAEFNQVAHLDQGMTGWVVLAETPFYAEAGGQVADTGEIRGKGFTFTVELVKRFGEVIFHKGRVAAGTVAPARVTARIDAERRHRIMRNHTATHLAHAALRRILGDHVQQSGSLVEPERLRFDFSHFTALTPAEIAAVERQVNEAIRANVRVSAREMPYSEALEKGALAFFGDRYGDVVRVVESGPWASELCGGTHVRRTGDIGFFRITNEGSISSGVRRIEAVTGDEAVELSLQEHETLNRLRELTGSGEGQLSETVENLLEEIRTLRKGVAAAAQRRGLDQVKDLISAAVEVDGIAVVRGRIEAPDIGTLRTLADSVRSKIGRGIGVLGMEQQGKAVLLCVVSDDLVSDGWQAGAIVSRVAEIVGGTGGGKPHMAQAGGPEGNRLDEALGAVPDIIRSWPEEGK